MLSAFTVDTIDRHEYFTRRIDRLPTSAIIDARDHLDFTAAENGMAFLDLYLQMSVDTGGFVYTKRPYEVLMQDEDFVYNSTIRRTRGLGRVSLRDGHKSLPILLSLATNGSVIGMKIIKDTRPHLETYAPYVSGFLTLSNNPDIRGRVDDSIAEKLPILPY